MSLSINQTLVYKLEQGCERASTLQLNVRYMKGKDQSVNLTNIKYVSSQTFQTKGKEAINVHKILYSSNIQVKPMK